ncbi:MAG: TerD family protein [Methylococcales bacterium]|nr:TerD family protein [Methylococcales bacterium]
MAVSLSKGGNVNLSKEAPGLSHIKIGLGWDARATDGAAFDLDAVGFLLKDDGKILSDNSFIFYNNKTSECGSVVHLGDNTTGEGDGDDEAISVDLAKVPAEISKFIVAVTIHDAETRNQNFGQVSNAFVRVINDSDNKEIARYDLSEDASVETAMVFGELYRNGNDWKFRAVGQGFAGGLGPLASSYGVSV